MDDGKDKPGGSSSAEIDEGWDALDEAIEAAVEPAPSAPPPAPAARGVQTAPLSTPAEDRSKTDQDHPVVRPEDVVVSESAEEEWDVALPTAKHLPRDLPTAPPNERRVAKTIMGVGTPELQAALKLRLAAAQAAPAPTPPPSSTARTEPSTMMPESQALAETDQLAVPEEDVPPIASLAATAPLSSVGPTPTPPPPVPFAETSPAIEPLTVRMRPGGGPAVTPTAATRRAQPERRPGQGPSNLALILLWTVALLSVGLALYLYFARG